MTGMLKYQSKQVLKPLSNMRNFLARLKTLELKNPTPCTAEQEKAFRDILSYLDSLAERKTSGDTLVQAEIEMVNQFLRAQ